MKGFALGFSLTAAITYILLTAPDLRIALIKVLASDRTIIINADIKGAICLGENSTVLNSYISDGMDCRWKWTFELTPKGKEQGL